MTSFVSRCVRAVALAVPAIVVAVWVSTAHGIGAQPVATSAPAGRADAGRGKIVYQTRCVECHGESGRGDGPASQLLTPRPRDLTTAKYKIRSTESGNVPT